MYIMKEPEYWRITDAVEKVIAKHTYVFNCQRIMERAGKDKRPFSSFIYIAVFAIEAAKFSMVMRSSSKPKTQSRIYDIRGTGQALISADELRDLLS